ncbi:phosphate ABC transporter substrate-binding protein PstS [Mycolicibacterium fallax]|uniref:Phosphate-binding protein n=1 Tax=Mycolicibacterium fallax TaxID=1793 RepID=A0A1X1RFF7_MYCFA|nr:phosphate ABC transporter substrate-binding protein PstS [Mycolicibacterium fallax]ORV04561.1 phosphate-binding protein [Mycolicibacterium fallax]BBY99703.1 phosphate-binding protein PstS [Mycolicibacterium fallax]
MVVSLNRSATLSIVAAAVLLVAGCGSDQGRPSYAESATVECGGKDTLVASGSTAQANAMARFVEVYQKTCPGKTVDYTSNGSAAGVSEFLDGRTDFGGSDSPLAGDEYTTARQRCGSEAWNLPVVFGPLGITYNLDGVDTLVLDAPTLARIFNGSITRWNDPAIKDRNPAVPDEPIRVVFRSDGSGTTANFQRYLDAASGGAWGKGTGKVFNGGVGQGSAGNEGTSATVKNTPGAISYNEWSFAQDLRLKTAKILTSAGPEPVTINAATVQKTIANATITGAENNLVLDTSTFYNPTEPGAYPIVLATYQLVCSTYSDPQTGTAVRAFLQSTVTQGQVNLEDHGYFPLPDQFQARVADAVNAIR